MEQPSSSCPCGEHMDSYEQQRIDLAQCLLWLLPPSSSCCCGGRMDFCGRRKKELVQHLLQLLPASSSSSCSSAGPVQDSYILSPSSSCPGSPDPLEDILTPGEILLSSFWCLKLGQFWVWGVASLVFAFLLEQNPWYFQQQQEFRLLLPQFQEQQHQQEETRL